MDDFIKNGDLPSIVNEINNGFRLTTSHCGDAAKYGHLRILAFFHVIGTPWSMYTTSCAAKYGHINCLMYAFENGCPFSKQIANIAAENGQLECLAYVHKNGCTILSNTCRAAAINGHLDCLMFAHTSGYYVDRKLMIDLVHAGKYQCFDYLAKSGVRFNALDCLTVAIEKRDFMMISCIMHLSKN
jgi:hypothetical protein